MAITDPGYVTLGLGVSATRLLSLGLTPGAAAHAPVGLLLEVDTDIAGAFFTSEDIDFASDLSDAFFSVADMDFAEDLVVGANTVRGILTTASFVEGEVVGPRALIADSDSSKFDFGDTVTARSGTLTYTVAAKLPDGTGVTELVLNEVFG